MIPYHELKKSVQTRGDEIAFITDDNTSVTFEALVARVEKLAGALQNAEIGKGDVIAVLLPNGMEFVELFLAAGAVGAVFQPLDIRFKGEELTHALTHTGTKALVLHGSGVEAVESGLPDIQSKLLVAGERESWTPYEAFLQSGGPPAAAAGVDEDRDNAVFLFTSGTTGSLKCVPMTWRQLDHFPRDMVSRLAIGPEDVGITLIPMSHISGPIVISMVVSVGCSFVVTQRWRPDINSGPVRAAPRDLDPHRSRAGRSDSQGEAVRERSFQRAVHRLDGHSCADDDAGGAGKGHPVVQGHPGVRSH
jgi:acyl-CoA synthetase (AMP-forming)/AMP-acid ligase II